MPLQNQIECRRFYGSPPEIYRSEVTLGQDYRGAIEGRKFLLRSDFPVLCYLDNKLVGAAGAPFFAPYYRFEVGEHESPSWCRFALPPGWGGDATGGRTLVQSQILARHGVCCLDAAWSGEAEPMLPQPDLLPLATIVCSNLTGTAGTTNPNWGTITQAQAVWALNNNVLPHEFYVKAVVINCEMTSTYTALTGVYCYEWQLRKNNSPAGDNQFFLILNQNPNQNGIVQSMPNLKLPLRSIFAPYAAETPTLDITAFGTIDPLIAPVVHSRIIGGYVV